MKIFTLTMGGITLGAYNYGTPLSVLPWAPELELQPYFRRILESYGTYAVLTRASLERWGESYRMIPEQTEGHALVVINIPTQEHAFVPTYLQFISFDNGEMLKPGVLRIAEGETCELKYQSIEAHYPLIGSRRERVVEDIRLKLSFLNGQMSLEKNGVLVLPDAVLC